MVWVTQLFTPTVIVTCNIFAMSYVSLNGISTVMLSGCQVPSRQRNDIMAAPYKSGNVI
jgi:hypothetical protein